MALGRPILRPVMWLAAAGLVASAVVHALALLGVGLPLGGAIWLLHLGIFVGTAESWCHLAGERSQGSE
jgi:hypothetical protein